MSDIEKYLSELVSKYHNQLEEFSRVELEKILLELIQSGDLVRLCTPEKAYSMHPFRDEIRLESYNSISYIPFRLAKEQQIKLKEKDKEIEDIYHQIEATLIMNDKTSKKLEIALDALEFYSHEKNRDGWGVGQVAGLISGHRYDISCCACNEENKGKTARQALEKISKLESEK